MFRCTHFSTYFTSAALLRSKSSWDPVLSLTLRHPTLVILEKCRTREHFKQILAQMMKQHLVTQTFPMSRLIYFSTVSHPENLDMAILLFNHYTPQPNLYIYNTMISALSSSSQSIFLYRSMLRSCIYPDEHTLLHLLKAAGCLSLLKQIHGHIIVTGFWLYSYLQNSLIKMYFENGNISLAYQVFWQMGERDTISYNTMISGCAKGGHFSGALDLFQMMGVEGLEADYYTMVSLLKCFGHLGDVLRGKEVHAWIERRRCVRTQNLILGNALLDMYVKCREMKLVQRVFDEMGERDVVSWNTLIAGYAEIGSMTTAYGLFNEMPTRDLVSWNSLLAGYARLGNMTASLKVFEEMLAVNERPDKITLVNLISACAESGMLDQGRCIHGWLVKSIMNVDAFLGSALIDMYCKCGSISRALKIFRRICEKDVTIWTSMISGLAFHGLGIEALQLFREMKSHLKPNGVTFIAILAACSHAGLVDEGRKIFESMERHHNIKPAVEHYGCLVDLLGRAGKLTEAKEVIEKMPMDPSRSIWGAMLSACKERGNIDLAEVALKELMKLEPEEEGGYVSLSNMYAVCERWSSSDGIRKNMEGRGVKKMAGRSSVVVDGVMHEFVAADKQHRMWRETYCMLMNLKRAMMEHGGVSFQQLLGPEHA
ncbi:Pentatricopeptide repeat-containing protein [Acorus calamus]|uniref:Pentatricopeptide repeat-containing protein n=1 Tax=Acorus calamus TaxID=4465 RepID=A0AAV9D8V5_ACOCL|nr:Pentatricopeptide repeat-containing protein [Acorus calamus]